MTVIITEEKSCFIDRLMNRVKELQNPTIMGLDPELEFISKNPSGKELQTCGTPCGGSASILEFNKKPHRAVNRIVPRKFKPQWPLEMYGSRPERLCGTAVCREKFMVVADAKRE